MTCAAREMTAVASKVLRIRCPPWTFLPFIYGRSHRRSFAMNLYRYQVQSDESPESDNQSDTPVSRSTKDPQRPSSVGRSDDDPKNPRGGHIPFDTATLKSTERHRQTQGSTMTDMEIDAFAKLFGTLTTNDARSIDATQTKSHQRKKPIEEQTYIAGLEEEVLGRSAGDETSLDVQSSIYDIEQIYAEQLAPDVTATLDRYPSAIRAMAKRAEIRRVQEQERQQTKDPVLLKAKAEMRRVEKLLLACKTDHQVWDVMQAEVFAKVAQMNQELEQDAAAKKAPPPQPETDPDTTASSAKQKPKPKRAKATTTTTDPAQTPSKTPTPNLQLLTHTYAPLLLLAVRLLLRRTATSRPSALAPALLHAARALGTTSYALAASTPLYNALLQDTWRRTAQYSQVFGLLREMEQAGLSMDGGTLEVVEEMGAFPRVAARGGFGKAVGAVEEGLVGRRAEAEEVAAWRERIWEGIRAKEVERARRDSARREVASEEAAERGRDGEVDDGRRDVTVAAAAAAA